MLPTDVMHEYPDHPRERDRWVLARRGARNQLDPFKPRAFFVEEERAESGEVVSVATILLTNRECPWRCLMCDLWKNTLTETVLVGAVLAQIDYALDQCRVGVTPAPNSGKTLAFNCLLTASQGEGRRDACPTLRQIKLYNSGSFFDPRAIPPEDYVAIADRVRAFERVIVECHPALVGESALEFRDLLNAVDASEARPPVHRPKLEVAMGLETAHPEVLAKLNKRMTLDQFRRAAEFLRQNEIALRVFVLVKPPFLDEAEALHWAERSMDFAFDCGATVVSLIPTRFGNGALEALAEHGEFSPPKLATLEAALDYGIALKRGRVFADLWDVEQFSDCKECLERRRARLGEMNLRQTTQPRVACECCRERTR